MQRTYFRCPRCGQGDFGADGVLGLDGYLTVAAQRMACLAGVQESFAKAEQMLRELAGWQLDQETIRRLCHTVAAQASATTSPTLACARNHLLVCGVCSPQQGFCSRHRCFYQAGRDGIHVV